MITREGKSRYCLFHSWINTWVACETVWSSDNACHTWTLLWWGWPIRRRYIQDYHLYFYLTYQSWHPATKQIERVQFHNSGAESTRGTIQYTHVERRRGVVNPLWNKAEHQIRRRTGIKLDIFLHTWCTVVSSRVCDALLTVSHDVVHRSTRIVSILNRTQTNRPWNGCIVK